MSGVAPAENTFCPCGLAVDSRSPRCRACPQSPPGSSSRPAVPTASAPVLRTYSRWTKSPTTFGPVGRIVATVLLLLPLPVLGVAASLFVGLVGAGIYLLVIVPWALKDIWQRAAIPASPPESGTMPRSIAGS